MLPFVTDQVVWFVGLSIALVSTPKMAEPIKMPFGLWTLVGPRNHILNGVQIPRGKWQFLGEGVAQCKVSGILSMCGGDAAFCQITLTSCYVFYPL